MRIRIEPRGRASARARAAAPALAALAAAAMGSAVFPPLGVGALEGLRAFLVVPVSDLQGLSELLVKASPLALIALGLSFAFRAGVWNIGAEGQFILGAVAAGGVALSPLGASAPAALLLPAMAAAGAAGGAAWAGVVAFLRLRFSTNEILPSLMLSYVAQLLLLWLVQGPWRDPGGFNFPETRLFPEAAMLPAAPGTRLHAGVALAVPAALAAWLLLHRSVFGFQVRVLGAAPRAARFAGFPEGRVVAAVLLGSGAAAGLAGMLEVSGVVGQLVPRVSPGYGFTAIIVAFLGGLRPLGVLAAALAVALTHLGGESAQMTLGLPVAAVGVFQGLLLFCVLAAGFPLAWRVRVAGGRGPRGGRAKGAPGGGE